MHLREVQGAIHAAGERRQVDVEGELGNLISLCSLPLGECFRTDYLLVGELNTFVIFAVRVEEVHARRGAVVRAIASGNVLLEGHDVSISGDSACFVVESLDNTVFVAGYAVEAYCAGVAHGA